MISKTQEIKNQDIETQVNNMFEHIRRKKAISKAVFIGLNISIFSLAALLIILNLFSIRYSPADDSHTKWMFVALSMVVAASTFITSLLSIFVYRRKSIDRTNQIKMIKIEKKKFSEKAEGYEGPKKQAELKLLQKLDEILNIELH